MDEHGVKVLDKAFLLLSQFYNHDELLLKELVELTKLNRSTVYRIMQVLLKWGYVERDDHSGRYSVSLKILELSGAMLRKMSLLNVCRPFLLDLRDRTGESSFLSVLRDRNIIIIDWEPSYFDALINVTVGKAVPAYTSGAGKAILAFLPPEERESLLAGYSLHRYTDKTVCDLQTLKEVLRKTAEIRYGVSRGEYDADIVVVAAPIFDIHNRVIASCAIGALKSRVKSEGQICEYGKMVIAAASQISRKLGSSGSI